MKVGFFLAFVVKWIMKIVVMMMMICAGEIKKFYVYEKVSHIFESLFLSWTCSKVNNDEDGGDDDDDDLCW